MMDGKLANESHQPPHIGVYCFMSRLMTILVGLLSCFLLTIMPVDGAEFHVAPTGKDSNPGTQQQPFATLEAARDAIRKHAPTEPRTVLVHNGTYCLQQPFILSSEDSGTPEAPVTYRAAEPGKVIISGGRQIRGWQPGEGKLWQVEIPEVRQGKWYFHALFVNGHCRLLSFLLGCSGWPHSWLLPLTPAANPRDSRVLLVKSIFALRAGPHSCLDAIRWPGTRKPTTTIGGNE